ncbi:trehalose-phosphatase [Streptomyces odontomachi]|uniref:trehalose-phosphatase n=1 Tax=Streptomyces odontomachi TaxID=2944940 RepID=UPI00210A74F9|nr:trehalose-phosphatase [Streptomyces sp. ODS25]
MGSSHPRQGQGRHGVTGDQYPAGTTDSTDSTDSADPADPAASAGSAPAVPEPATEAGRSGLAALLADPARAVIAFDFDGTLAPIVADPGQARAHPGAVPALAALAPRVRSVAIITGRPALTAVEHGSFAGVAGLEHLVVLGHYGAERWDAATNTLTAPDPHPGVTAVRAELPDLLERHAAGGAWIEDKGFAVAVHTRRAADPQAAFEALREPLGGLAARHRLAVEPGRFVLELRPPGMDKGVALTRYVREVGGTSVLYGGDDLGDLPAFAAVDKLRSDGIPGLLVCSGSTETTDIAERSDLVVDGPGGMVQLVAALAEAMTG